MPKSKSEIFKFIFVVLFLASCTTGVKRGFSDSSNSSRTRSNPNASTSPLQLKSPIAGERSLIQELTGKPVSQIPTQQELKNKPLSTQHYYAGLRATESKNYILAIKHFNTVLKKYPRSMDVNAAFSAKAKVYKEMGLLEPAALNLKMAQNPKVKVIGRKSAAAGKSTTQK